MPEGENVSIRSRGTSPPNPGGSFWVAIAILGLELLHLMFTPKFHCSDKISKIQQKISGPNQTNQLISPVNFTPPANFSPSYEEPHHELPLV